MSWLLPTPLLLFTGVVALRPVTAVVRRPTSPARLVAEAFGIPLGVVAFVQRAWIALWLIEQRW